MMNKILLKTLLISTIFGAAATAQAANPADVNKSFFPYKAGKPTVPGLRAGMVLNQGNVDSVKAALDPETYRNIKTGAVQIRVAPTTDFALHRSYINASLKGNTTLGGSPGQINNFVAGRPFPQEPVASDPRAGEKLAWNYKYGYNWGDSAAISPFYWKYRNMKTGKVERKIKFNFHFLNYKHRVQHSPVPNITPNPSDLFRAIYVKVLEPFDLKNTQLLIHRSDNDLKRDNSYLYLGFQRRVRRLATGQITDAFLGSDIMIEDFEGYNGRISDMKWTYKGTKNLLMPFYNHNQQKLTNEFKDRRGYKFVDFHGKGGCFPNVTWQLRKVYVLESKPKSGGHPISKRVHYVDAQTFTLPRTLIYDRGGKLWKSWTIGQAHPDSHLPKNRGTGVSIDDSFSMIDVQAQHCTTGQFKGQVDPKLNPAKLFSVQNLRSSGG